MPLLAKVLIHCKDMQGSLFHKFATSHHVARPVLYVELWTTQFSLSIKQQYYYSL